MPRTANWWRIGEHVARSKYLINHWCLFTSPSFGSLEKEKLAGEIQNDEKPGRRELHLFGTNDMNRFWLSIAFFGISWLFVLILDLLWRLLNRLVASVKQYLAIVQAVISYLNPRKDTRSHSHQDKKRKALSAKEKKTRKKKGTHQKKKKPIGQVLKQERD